MKTSAASILVLLSVVACTPSRPPDPTPVASASVAAATSPAATPVAPAAEPAAGPEGTPSSKVPDIEYVPTPENIVAKMLEVAGVKKDDVLYDLGCGDGRIVVTAAKKFGVKAKGFDVDPQRIKESKANVEKNGVGNLVTIEQKDIFEVDLSPASVVTLYLLPELNVRLIPQLQKLKPGSRIVSHDFDMEGVDPIKYWTVLAPDHR